MIICSIIQVKPDKIVLDLPHSTYFLLKKVLTRVLWKQKKECMPLTERLLLKPAILNFFKQLMTLAP